MGRKMLVDIEVLTRLGQGNIIIYGKRSFRYVDQLL